MKTEVYANKDWQHVGKVPEAGNIYADGMWCFNVGDRTARTCDADGKSGRGNYYPLKIDEGDQSYPYSGKNARVGQLIFRVGEKGMPEAFDMRRGSFEGGEDLWMRINDSGLDDNDGCLTLRFASAADSRDYDAQFAATNSYGDPIGTQYDRDGAGNYVKRG
ncbi:hypothetical protein [Nocardia abscessus]|uniref:hypothetical protein n=1 Tax=Nocardia abscessus TaxID=120957 RepID=UPI002455FE29|nr:hypothetical protein [Nocardia abscessus]